MKKMNLQTTNMVDENIKRIGELFPNCLTERLNDEGKPEVAIDFDQLRQELSRNIVEGNEERYQFTWPDKRNAIRLANAPTTDTLRPCREESVDFDNTQNLYIEGDNLQVLKLLRENYLGKVKMIYIDPPYNTGNDFVYNDNFDQDKQEYVHNSGQYDEEGYQMVTNTESNGRFHTDWLNMIYPRLKVAKDLLSEDGYICVSIDDNEIENVKKLCSEVFGPSNFVSQFIVIRSEGGGLAKRAVIGHDYLIVFARNIEKCRPLGRPKDIRGKIVNKNGEDYWIETDWFREVFGKYGTCHYEDILKFYNQSKKDEIDKGIAKGDYVLIPRDGKHIIGRYRRVAEDTSKFYTIVKHLNKNGVTDLQEINMNKFFDYPKPVSLVREFIQGVTILSKSDGDVILDFFSGSATTAHAVMQLNAEDGGNRKFIMVQLPEKTDEKSEAYKSGYKNICEIGKERIRRAGKKIKEESPLTTQDLDTGFRVLKLDSSNMQDVYYTPSEFNEQKLFDDNIKPDRTEEDLLFQTMIELGIELSAKIEKRSIAGKTVWSVNDGYLMACFDEEVNETTITEIARQQPYYFVMRDSSLANDQVADNFEQIWEEYSKDTIRRII
ncbi:MAG: site-specific DNA-methyltransferase [Paludibacteraceae bacterium]|nr:site-specific DNA-methyltransferase [Paludibacteraceae bacterium]